MSCSGIDFQSLFGTDTGLYLVLRPDLTIAGASDAYLLATLRWRDELLGCLVFEAFPDNPSVPEAHGVDNLGASLRRVLAEGTSDTMPEQRYDVQDHFSQSNTWVERHWRAVNVPVFAPDGLEIVYVVHRILDVTRFVLARRCIEEELLANREMQDTVRAMQRDLLSREVELRDLLESVESGSRRPDAKKPPAGGDALDPVARWLPDGAPRQYLSPGERTSVRGLYWVFHQAWCRAAKSETAAFPEDRVVPRCVGCQGDVRYRLAKAYEPLPRRPDDPAPP